MNRGIAIIATIFLLLVNAFIKAQAPPHIVQGYIYYDGKAVDEAEVILINIDKSIEINTTSCKGMYIFAVPSDIWQNGDRAKLIVNYKQTKEVRFIIDLNKIPQWINVSIISLMANFSYAPLNPTDLDEIKFYDKSIGYIINYTWNFGDGNYSYEKNPVHRYANDGIYNVTLTVKDKEGKIKSIKKMLKIRNVAPIANFTYFPKKAKINEEIRFNSTSYDLDGYIINYTWNFGDGSYSYEKNPTHSYTNDGIYNVTLIVKDDDGAVSYKEEILHIASKKAPDFEALPSLLYLILISFLKIFKKTKTKDKNKKIKK